ncbi:tetratricopeptide repeat protein [Actinokineospora enzanensis]|uniref:tetratricopeptide repeat protein n=1 Tax=Actinokineospora enzanensis TaxID=155975 RepID=UPI0003671B05|nr:tetratricopeptide repeat protein [Actinokineospora enzanensis]
MRRRDRKALDRAIDQARQTGPAETAVALRTAGEAYLADGEPDVAFTYFSQAMGLCDQLGDVGGRLRLLTAFALVHRANLRFTAAAETYRQALELSTALGLDAVTENLEQKLAAMSAAEKAGVDIPDGLIQAAASAGPGRMWVYEIDENLAGDDPDHIPSRAIRRGWEVDDGELTGLIVPNVDYRG